MNQIKPQYHRYRFSPEIIGHAVWLYHRFSLSFRDIEDLLAERGKQLKYTMGKNIKSLFLGIKLCEKSL